MASFGQNNGVLETSPKIVSINNASIPATLVLNSTDAAAKIEVSGGNDQWYTLPNDYSTASQKVAVLKAPFLFVRFTGAVNDTYSIL